MPVDGEAPNRIWANPLFVLLVGIVLLYLLVNFVFFAFFYNADVGHYWLLAGAVISSALALYLYRRVIAGLLERRRAPLELRWRPDLLAYGLLIAVAFVVIVLGAVALLGNAHITRPHAWAYAAAGSVALALKAGITEELFYRGILFRIPQHYLGTVGALILSAVLFGAMHTSNAGATWWTTVCVVVAGLFLAALYVVSGSLWLPIAAHFGWNAAIGLSGVPVSGHVSPGPYATALSGSSWVTGGRFGVEGSVVTVLVFGTGTVLALAVAARRGHFVAPGWSKPRTVAAPEPGDPLAAT